MSLSRSASRHNEKQKRRKSRLRFISTSLIVVGVLIVALGVGLSLDKEGKLNKLLPFRGGQVPTVEQPPGDGNGSVGGGPAGEAAGARADGSNRNGEAGGEDDSSGDHSEDGAEDAAGGETAPQEPGAFGGSGDEGEFGETVSLSFVGDVLHGEYLSGLMAEQGFDYPYRQALLYLSEPDIMAGTLELPVTTRGTPIVGMPYVYRGSPDTLPALRDAGFDVMALANNHMLDQGVEGMLDTMRHLDEAGIGHMGAGSNDTEAFAPYIAEAKGIKVAYVGFSRVIPYKELKADRNIPGVAETYDTTRAVAAIRKAAEEADIVVAMVHWGEDGKDMPVQYQKDFAREYIDAGADLVIGSHPHVLQGFEMYKGKWIAYSLGNFAFTVYPKGPLAETGVLDASCTKEGECRLKFNPMTIVAGQPTPMEEEARQALLERLTSISFGVRLERDGTIAAN